MPACHLPSLPPVWQAWSSLPVCHAHSPPRLAEAGQAPVSCPCASGGPPASLRVLECVPGDGAARRARAGRGPRDNSAEVGQRGSQRGACLWPEPVRSQTSQSRGQ